MTDELLKRKLYELRERTESAILWLERGQDPLDVIEKDLNRIIDDIDYLADLV
jgi:hypothetical protein